MYFQFKDKKLIYRDTPNSIEKSLDLSIFDFVSGFRISKETQQIFLTGVLSGKKTPSLSENSKGNMQLFKVKDNGEGWENITSSYAHDPAPINKTNYIVFHNGRGVSVVDHSGSLIFESKSGRFNWGAPSVSSSPNGTRISYVKWEGDNQKLICGTLNSRSMERYKPSLFRYSWFNDDTIVFSGVGKLKLLDLNTGKSKVFINDLAKEVKNCSVFDSNNQEFQEFLTNNEDRLYSFSTIQTTTNYLFFVCQIIPYPPSYEAKTYYGLFSISKDKKTIRLIRSFDKGTAVSDFEVDNKGNIQLFLEHRKGIKDISASTLVLGPDSEYLNNGWMIMRVGSHPEFGFHYLGQLD